MREWDGSESKGWLGMMPWRENKSGFYRLDGGSPHGCHEARRERALYVKSEFFSPSQGVHCFSYCSLMQNERIKASSRLSSLFVNVDGQERGGLPSCSTPRRVGTETLSVCARRSIWTFVYTLFTLESIGSEPLPSPPP